jgi:hypothetical protein
VNLKVEGYYPSGKRFFLRFKDKGGKEKETPPSIKNSKIDTDLNPATFLGSTLKQPA